jgi:hypothetical protein
VCASLSLSAVTSFSCIFLHRRVSLALLRRPPRIDEAFLSLQTPAASSSPSTAERSPPTPLPTKRRRRAFSSLRSIEPTHRRKQAVPSPSTRSGRSGERELNGRKRTWKQRRRPLSTHFLPAGAHRFELEYAEPIEGASIDDEEGTIPCRFHFFTPSFSTFCSHDEQIGH